MPAFWLSKHSMDKYANENYFLDNTYLLRPLDFAMAIPGFAFLKTSKMRFTNNRLTSVRGTYFFIVKI